MHRPLSPHAPRHRLGPLCAAMLGMALAACSAGADPAAGQAAPGQPVAPDPDAIAFVGVNVVPMDRERVLEGHTVVIRDGRIASVAPDDSQVREGAQRIDGAGRWLMRGLAGMHGNLPGPDDAAYA